MYLYPELCDALAVRISPAHVSSALEFLQRTWNELVPGQPFEFSFVDEDYYNLYAGERRLGKIAGYVTLFVIIIACLGLFCLVALTTEMRTKEIGIRKVLGAGLSDIVVLLSREFVVLIVFAIFAAWPIAWYAMQRWLQHFAYHIPLSQWIFILSGFFTLGTGLLAVFSRALSAGSANPVDSLTYE